MTTCTSTKASNSQYDFTSADYSYTQASLYLANLRPNLKLNDNFTLQSIGSQQDPLYNVLTLNSCRGVLLPYPNTPTGDSTTVFSAVGIATGPSSYKGVSSAGLTWPTGAALVINVIHDSFMIIPVFISNLFFDTIRFLSLLVPLSLLTLTF